jgi:predicted Zn-dependent protease
LTAPLRALLALLALAAAVWLGLSWHSAHLEQQAANVALLQHGVSSAAADDALAKLRRARRWQPDSQLELLEWRLDLGQRRFGAATAVLKNLVANEPQNAEAWFYLSHTAQDPRLARTARRRFGELVRGG